MALDERENSSAAQRRRLLGVEGRDRSEQSPGRLADTAAVFAALDSQPGATRGFGTEASGGAAGRPQTKAATPAEATPSGNPDARHGGKREEIERLARTIFFAEDVTAKGNEPGDRENVVVTRC